jgi:hypothetical protein
MKALAKPPIYWYALQDLADRCLPWPRHGALDGIDPYLAWLDATRFTGTPQDAGSGWQCPLNLPVLVKASLADGRPYNPMTSGGFGTLRVQTNRVLDLRRDRRIVDGLIGLPIVMDLAATVGLPRASGIHRLDHRPSGMPVSPPPKRPQPVIAVIDDGCPFAHAGLRRGSAIRTRISWLWDQGSDTCSHAPPKFGYGREWTGSDLDAVMTSCAGPTGAVDEDACYRTPGMDLHGGAYRHGAHTLGLVAGAPDPWRNADSRASVDGAAEADILFVQLPRASMVDTSGGALPVQVLDALRWIDEHTRLEVGGGKPPIEVPVVINLSIGASAGAHDGSSLIAQAIDQFLAGRDHAMVVMAAGNARAERRHISLRVDPAMSFTVPWDISADDGTDSFMELWWARTGMADGGAPLLRTRLLPPGVPAEHCPWVTPGEAWFALDVADPQQVAAAGVISMPTISALGDAKCLLLTVAPTVGNGAVDRTLAPAGRWRIEIENVGDEAAQIDAWIERDDAAFGSGAWPSEFGDAAAVWLRDDGTLTSLAHGRGPLVVGGYERDGTHSRAGPLDDHAGEGPGRMGYGRAAPDLIAPCRDTGDGVLSWGVHTGEWARASGTSAAAATVSRRLYNELHRRWQAGVQQPAGPAAIKAALSVDLAFDPTLEALSRVGRGRLIVV